MKNLFLLFTIAASVAMVGCDPSENSWQWWIKNNTHQTLKLKHFSFAPNTPTYVTATISPGDSIVLYRTKIKKEQFDHYFEKSAELYGEDIYWQILSENDVVLKTWNYSDKGMQDQQLFDESRWAYDQRPGQTDFVLIEYLWTFDILPEYIR